MKINKILPILVTASTVSVFSHTANAVDLELGDGWSGTIGLQLQAFLADNENTVTGESATRIQSGFDPSKLTFKVVAPEYKGITVSGTYQYVQAINGPRSSGDATFNGEDGGQAQVRVAQLAIAGDFGTVKVGRGIGIFGLPALAHDTGSLPGIGRGGIIAGGGGTAGRIDYGYYYPDFHAGLTYESNDFGGVSFSAGVFDPINGANDPSEELRFEAAINYKSKPFDLWASAISSSTEGEDEQKGFDFGGEARFGGVAITANYSDGTGTACCVPNTDDFSQWFVEADYTAGSATYGLSYGENEKESVSGVPISDGELLMLFVHYKMTPTLTLIGEINNENIADGLTGVDTRDVDTIGVGFNWQF